jgi:hypothetical protein
MFTQSRPPTEIYSNKPLDKPKDTKKLHFISGNKLFNELFTAQPNPDQLEILSNFIDPKNLINEKYLEIPTKQRTMFGGKRLFEPNADTLEILKRLRQQKVPYSPYNQKTYLENKLKLLDDLKNAEWRGDAPSIRSIKKDIKKLEDKHVENSAPLEKLIKKVQIKNEGVPEKLGTTSPRMLPVGLADPYASDEELRGVRFDNNKSSRAGSPLMSRSSSPSTIRSESPSRILESLEALQQGAPRLAEELARAATKRQTKESLTQGRIPTEWHSPTAGYAAAVQESEEARKTREALNEIQKPAEIALQAPMRGLVDISSTRHGSPEQRQFQHDVFGVARENYMRKYNPYTGEKIPDLSDAEERAHEMQHFLNPFTNKEQQAHYADIEQRIQGLDELNSPSEAAEPYLNRMSENPLKLQEKLFGESERQQLNDILAAEDENFFDNVLPQLKRKYMVPGLKRHGGMQRSIDEATKKYQKQRGRLANEFRNENKKFSIGAAQNYAQQQGTAAGLSAQNAIHDTGEGLRKAQASQSANQEKNRAHYTAAGILKEKGALERDIRQKKYAVAELEHNAAEAHPDVRLNQLIAAGAQMPLTASVQTSTINAANQHPYVNSPNTMSTIGAGLIGSAANQVPFGSRYAKGGSVKNRKKKAGGGSIMGEAVQNAVIDREDPLKALHKLMNRQRLAEMQNKSMRRRLRVGGPVSPIQQGANQANEYLGEKNLRSHYEGLKTPPERSLVGSLINDFMTGAAAANEGVARPRALGLGARAYTKVADKNALERQKANELKTRAFENIYKLDKDREKLDFDLRREARDDKRLQLDETRTAADVARMGGERNPPKLQRDEQEILSSAAKFGMVAPDILKVVARLRELSGRLKTGKFGAVKLGMDSPWTQEQLGHGKKADFEEFDALAKTLANYDMSVMQGTKGGAQLLRLLREQKVNGQMNPAAIKNILDTIEAKTVRGLEQADQITTNYQEGISPRTTIMNFRKKEQAEDEAEKAKKAKEKADQKAKEEAKYPTATNAPAHNGALESLTPHLDTADTEANPQDTVQEYNPSAGVSSEPIPLNAPMQSQPQMNPQRQKALDAKRQELAQIEEEEANLRGGGN